MARRKALPPPSPGNGLPILPRHLIDHPRLSGAELREVSAERIAWFRANGIDPANWSEVHPILLASWEAHGIPERGALERHRLQLNRPPSHQDAT